jgi:hypothetical protein
MNFFNPFSKRVAAFAIEHKPISSTADILESLARFHVVKLNGVFQDMGLLKDIRDAIEISDFFAVDFESDASQPNKTTALARFQNTGQQKTLPAFPLSEVPLARVGLQALLKSAPSLQNLLRARQGQDGSNIHSCWARPLNNTWAERKTEWLWHQDKPFHVGDEVTIWIPLTPCGEDAPGLEFRIKESATTIFPLNENGWSLSDESVVTVGRDYKSFIPIFFAGRLRCVR